MYTCVCVVHHLYVVCHVCVYVCVHTHNGTTFITYMNVYTTPSHYTPISLANNVLHVPLTSASINTAFHHLFKGLQPIHCKGTGRRQREQNQDIQIQNLYVVQTHSSECNSCLWAFFWGGILFLCHNSAPPERWVALMNVKMRSVDHHAVLYQLISIVQIFDQRRQSGGMNSGGVVQRGTIGLKHDAVVPTLPKTGVDRFVERLPTVLE